MQSEREKRIRRSQWHQIFSNIKKLDHQFVFEWSRKDKESPEKIDSSIQYIDEDDLRVSRIGVIGKKKKAVNGVD